MFASLTDGEFSLTDWSAIRPDCAGRKIQLGLANRESTRRWMALKDGRHDGQSRGKTFG